MSPMRPRAFLLPALVVAACSTAPVPSAGSAEPSVVPSAPATAGPSVAASAAAAGVLTTGQLGLATWQRADGSVSYQVFATYSNTGTGWVEALHGSTNYQILDGTGKPVTVLLFPHAYPDLVAPGATGYMFDAYTYPAGSSVKISDLKTPGLATPNGEIAWRPANEPEERFTVDDISWITGPAGGLLAKGSVMLTGPSPVARASVAVFCIGANGDVLGGTELEALDSLVAGAAMPFTTKTETPALKADQCASTAAFAVDEHLSGGGD